MARSISKKENSSDKNPGSKERTTLIPILPGQGHNNCGSSSRAIKAIRDNRRQLRQNTEEIIEVDRII